MQKHSNTKKLAAFFEGFEFPFQLQITKFFYLSTEPQAHLEKVPFNYKSSVQLWFKTFFMNMF